MSHLPEPMHSEDRPDLIGREARCEIIPPFTEHPPCGFPGCTRASTGKHAEPIYLVEVRGISRVWGGLETFVTPICICNKCYATLGDLATDAYMEREKKAADEYSGDDPSRPCRDSGIPGPQQFADWQKLK